MAKRLPLKCDLKLRTFRFLITRPLVGGEAQLGRQEPAEGKLRCCLSLLDLYFGADQSAGSENQLAAGGGDKAVTNSKLVDHSNLITHHVSAPAQQHA